jgi:uncharacterized protein with PQ loop repeat
MTTTQNTKLEIIGWMGSIMFALCAIPQAWQSYTDGHSNGVNWLFLILWLSGEIFTLIYVVPKKHWPLIFNYIANVLFILIIVYFKIYPGSVS